ncbi:MAG: WD40 repeat domain-containing protein [Desulfobacterales bacterium]|nr:WD40 repeat domain-containing protein [Desulfobacterales bacterium]
MITKKLTTIFAVCLSLLIAAQSFAEEEDIQFKETITSLGAVPEDFTIIGDSVKYSTDFRQITYAAYKQKTHNIIRLDNRTSPVYHAVRPGFPRFSASGRHAYIAYKGKNAKASVVVDWETDGRYDNADNFRFSPDGKRYAYRAAEGEKQALIIDGKPDKWVTGIPMNDEDNILFSPNSQHIAYVAFEDEACRVVRDNKVQEHGFQRIKELTYSSNSKNLAYKGRVSNKGGREKWSVVVNGKKHRAYDHIFDLIFSPNSKHLAYVAVKAEDEEMVLVLNGQELDAHEFYGLPTFSPNSKKLAYAFRDGKNFHIVVNSNKSPAFRQIYKFYFSLDSSRYAYIAKKEDHWHCIIDGEFGQAHKKGVDAFKFSLDSSRYAYGALEEVGGKIVVDGEPHPTFLSVGEPYFSPDSKHTVYRARPPKIKGWTTIFDGEKKGNFYPAIAKYHFSKDSNHLAYNALIDFDQNVMVVDGKEYCKKEKFNIMDDPYFSPDSNNVAYIAAHGEKKEFFLVVNEHILPTQYGGFFKDTPIVFDDDRKFHTIGMREPGPEFLLIEVEIPENVKLETDLSDLEDL